jgi:hypothetical protein
MSRAAPLARPSVLSLTLLYNDALPQDARGGGCPDERLRMAVVMRHIIFDGARQIRETAERASTNAFACDVRKPAFDEVQPRGAGRYEVAMVSRMGGEPGLDLRVRVRAVVIEDQVNAPTLRGRPIELREEPQKLGMPFSRRAPATTVPSSTFKAANRLVVPCRT